ncbi:hypothetical protein FB566_0875 [Stackebrandtia endophytica]|uniref:Uncharacterized protein n=1 Tax=Stackebrandtia endophytica TaxID=1496996 RepID=A0A543AS21_9ACTN|nr:hypothetical protein [Stackebrandtia endophytica]TQL75374.1 hypothetical protein FB566_0875 [Stackebrandtia endophytica]
MSAKDIPEFRIGDSVRVQPHLALPTSPNSAEPFTAPFYYPGQIVETIAGTDPAMFIIRLDPHPFGPVWASQQAFTADAIHRAACVCGGCGEGDPYIPGAVPGDLVIPPGTRHERHRLVWVGHHLTTAELGEVLAYKLVLRGETPTALTRTEALDLLESALSWRSLEEIRADYDTPPAEILHWGRDQATRLFGPGDGS